MPKNLERLVKKLPRSHKYKGMEPEGEKLRDFLQKKYKKGRHGNPIDYKNLNNCGFEKPRKKASKINSKSCINSFKLCG